VKTPFPSASFPLISYSSAFVVTSGVPRYLMAGRSVRRMKTAVFPKLSVGTLIDGHPVNFEQLF
jgi:hypothetical protein